MSLNVTVGQLAYSRTADEEDYQSLLDQFAAINEALRAEGLPEHREPDELEGR